MDADELRYQSFVLGVGRRYPVEVFLQTISAPPNTHHASGVLLEIGGKIALLTAEHVLTGFEKMKANGRTVFQASGVSLSDPVSRVVHRDEPGDIVFLEMSATEAEKTRVLVHRPAQWPPPAPVEGDFVVIVGFPKEIRRQVSDREQEYGDFAGVLRVRRHTGDQFTCLLEREHAVGVSGRGVPPAGANYGGMSGGPVFSFERRHLTCPLVGIIKQDSPLLELFVVATLQGVPLSW